MYRKKVFLLMLVPTILACNPLNQNFSYHSNDVVSFVKSMLLTWEELFSILENHFIYVYSETCYHCNSIKKQITDFANNSVYPLYFVEFNENIPIGNDIESTIHATTVEGVFIKGTPTLILIENNEITFNIAGTEKILETIDLYHR